MESFRDQRLLFKILSRIKFINEAELREKLRTVYAQLRRQLREFVRHSLADRRTDVLITYLDGHGKSGEYIASLFAEENTIAVSNICSSDRVSERLQKAADINKLISAVVVVDDIAATGKTLANSICDFAEKTKVALKKYDAKLLACALYATHNATELILGRLKTLDLSHVDFRVGEILSSKVVPFSDDSNLWSNSDERERARTLTTELGARIYRNQPLGFGGLGLLVVFPTTVPNNSLPILHSASKGSTRRWVPLFPRPTN